MSVFTAEETLASHAWAAVLVLPPDLCWSSLVPSSVTAHTLRLQAQAPNKCTSKATSFKVTLQN